MTSIQPEEGRGEDALLKHYQDLAVERASETAAAEAERDSLRQMLMDEREEWIALLEPHHTGLPCEHCKGVEPTKVVSGLRAERDRLRDALAFEEQLRSAGYTFKLEMPDDGSWFADWIDASANNGEGAVIASAEGSTELEARTKAAVAALEGQGNG